MEKETPSNLEQMQLALQCLQPRTWRKMLANVKSYALDWSPQYFPSHRLTKVKPSRNQVHLTHNISNQDTIRVARGKTMDTKRLPHEGLALFNPIRPLILSGVSRVLVLSITATSLMSSQP